MSKYSDMICFSAGCAAPDEKVKVGAGRAVAPRANMAQSKEEETMMNMSCDEKVKVRK
jgi:hypothetical protein